MKQEAKLGKTLRYLGCFSLVLSRKLNKNARESDSTSSCVGFLGRKHLIRYVKWKYSQGTVQGQHIS